MLLKKDNRAAPVLECESELFRVLPFLAPPLPLLMCCLSLDGRLVKCIRKVGPIIPDSWFAAYLHGHTQGVSLKDTSGHRVLARPLPNVIGVFQGSSLGPLLFTIFSNNLSLRGRRRSVSICR